MTANENRYEGGWADDKKNGKGKFIFHYTKQVMEGVWVNDVARSCTIMDLGDRMQVTETTFPIPIVSTFFIVSNQNMKLSRGSLKPLKSQRCVLLQKTIVYNFIEIKCRTYMNYDKNTLPC